MQAPSKFAKIEDVIAMGRIHLDRTAMLPELEGQRTRFQVSQDHLEAVVAEWRSTRGNVRAAQINRDEMCTLLSDEMRSICTSVCNVTRHRRGSGSSNKYFVHGIGPLRPRTILIQRAGVLRAMLEEETDPRLRAHIEPLDGCINNANTSVANLAAARTAARHARGLVVMERARWLVEYRRNFYDITLLYSNIPGYAETFFWRPARRREEEDAKAERPVPTAVEERVEGAGAGAEAEAEGEDALAIQVKAA